MPLIYGQGQSSSPRFPCQKKNWIFTHLQKAYSTPQVKNSLCCEVVVRCYKNCTDHIKRVSICNYYFPIPKLNKIGIVPIP
jgi:hypothetical protein